MLAVLYRPLELVVFLIALVVGGITGPWISYRLGPVGTDTKGFAAAAGCLWAENPETFMHDQHRLTPDEAWDDARASSIIVSSNGECIANESGAVLLIIDRLENNVEIRRVARSERQEFVIVSWNVYYDFGRRQIMHQYLGSHRNWVTKPNPAQRGYALR